MIFLMLTKHSTISKTKSMAPKSISIFPFTFLLCFITISHSFPFDDLNNETFIDCLSNSISFSTASQILHTPFTTSYSSILLSSIQNLRFTSPKTPKPLFIITPTDPTQVQATVQCCKLSMLTIRVRSGGHDYEGLSYRTYKDLCPFVLLDLNKLTSITIDMVSETVWAQAGATLGELYYAISEKSSTHAFPGGVCSTIGLGGYISGGGIGAMVRKFGLAADNVIDAEIVDVDGKILNRATMGEDLFWAIRGGGGSFGIVLSWKLKLVTVPETVTVFTVNKTREEGAVKIIDKWQYFAPAIDENLFLEVSLQPGIVKFSCLYLGDCSNLVQLMNSSFPELGVKENYCREMKWIESALYLAGHTNGERIEVLLDRGLQPKNFYKAKSDFVTEPIPLNGLQQLWERFNEQGAGIAFMDPYGGKMNEISESATPFPHRAGNLYNIQYIVRWKDGDSEESRVHLNWIRSLYDYMGQFVSKHPRAAYVNFRDLDLGMNDHEVFGMQSFEKARVWGKRYFKDNFEKLAFVKAEVDPWNFFRNEQSIPPFLSGQKINGSSTGNNFSP